MIALNYMVLEYNKLYYIIDDVIGKYNPININIVVHTILWILYYGYHTMILIVYRIVN